MYLTDRLWALATTLVSFASLSSPPDHGFDNGNVQIPLQSAKQIVHQAPLVASPVSTAAEAGPTFRVPGIGESFECKYPSMVGWESCSTPEDRGCWLRRKSDGKRFDIETNYEDEMPIGIVRPYTLTLKNGWWAADGINFTEAQLFNHQYPGPWIQACWGDR